MLQFDPNNRKAPVIEWATYFPDRLPNFKIHKQKSHALNAFQYRDRGILYRHNGTEWVEVFRYEQSKADLDNCQRCGGTLHRTYGYQDRTYKAAYTVWISKEEPFKRQIVCTDCERQLRGH